MRAQDVARLKGRLQVSIGACRGAQRDSPLGRSVILGLDRAHPAHDISRVFKRLTANPLAK
jgi:hypothetical protein